MFSDIKLFTHIIKHGSMTAAAQALGVTPPVMTRRLAQLETRLGARLLNRTTRRINLTPEGETYLSEGTRLHDELLALESRLGDIHIPSGMVKVAASLGFGRAYLAPILSDFSKKYPQINVQLDLSDRTFNLVQDSVDVLIQFGEMPDSGLTARLLAHNRRILCAAPAYLKNHGIPAHPKNLAEHSCIFIRQRSETFGTWHFKRAREQATVKVRSNMNTNDGNSALTWALGGHGILLRSQWELAPHLRTKALVPLLLDWESPNADIYAVFQARHAMSAKVRALVDTLLAAFESHRKHKPSAENKLIGHW